MFVVSVLEGSYDDERRSAVVRDVTAAVARAEGTTFQDVAPRVWVFPLEVPDGRWVGRGVIVRLPDFIASVLGREAGVDAARRLAERHRKEAGAVLETAQGSIAAKAR